MAWFAAHPKFILPLAVLSALAFLPVGMLGMAVPADGMSRNPSGRRAPVSGAGLRALQDRDRVSGDTLSTNMMIDPRVRRRHKKILSNVSKPRWKAAKGGGAAPGTEHSFKDVQADMLYRSRFVLLYLVEPAAFRKPVNLVPSPQNWRAPPPSVAARAHQLSGAGPTRTGESVCTLA